MARKGVEKTPVGLEVTIGITQQHVKESSFYILCDCDDLAGIRLRVMGKASAVNIKKAELGA